MWLGITIGLVFIIFVLVTAKVVLEPSKKKKNKRKYNFELPVVIYREIDIEPTTATINDDPITDEYVLEKIRESIKPPTLPEQRVYDSVEDMMRSL